MQVLSLIANHGLLAAGLMAACSLVQLYGISADEALFRVQAAFDTREDLGELCVQQLCCPAAGLRGR